MAESPAGSSILTDTTDPDSSDEARQLFEQALAAEQKLDRWTAIELYERAFELAPDDEAICFRLAYNLDLVGEESEALHLYEQACGDTPARVNALMNLAVMYEDMGNYTAAERCLRQVVETNPNHARARLYLKDVMASRLMYYDETPPQSDDKEVTLMETPVTDFELSVRARNCLKKMNIRTLGDLLRTTEAELLGYKNFGETSLQEIKAMLSQRNLHLGQELEDRQTAIRQEVYDQLAGSGNEESLTKSVGELNLSVRARKALSLLGIQTVSDLIARTEAELLGIKNFGSTSLNEIKAKLTELGLSLRQLDA